MLTQKATVLLPQRSKRGRSGPGSETSVPTRPGFHRLRGSKGPARHTPRSNVQTPSRSRNAQDPNSSAQKVRAGNSGRPRILFLDIETAPLQSYHWGLWQQDIGLEQIGTEWSILSFAAKWLGEKKVHQGDTSRRGYLHVRDDRALLGEIWKLLDEADIVVAQNGKKFDVPKINARLLFAGFKPYSPIKIVDTLLVAKKHFEFTSNKLAWLSKHLSRAPKLEHREFPGFALWSECLKGNPRAWRVMRRYNIRDVHSLEDVYLALRPWIEGHPNVAAYTDAHDPACPKCGSTSVVKWGNAFTQTGKYQRYRCSDCGGFSRSRYTLNAPAKRRSLLSN